MFVRLSLIVSLSLYYFFFFAKTFQIFNIFSKTIRPIFIKLGTKNFREKGPGCLQKRYDMEKVKIWWDVLKIFYCITSKPSLEQIHFFQRTFYVTVAQ